MEEYPSLVAERPFGSFVNFSNPIFASLTSRDDFSFFLRERLDQEFNILSPEDYRLYGNQGGFYPVQTEVLGDFSRENLAKENKPGVQEFVINTHGQRTNIDQCIFEGKGEETEKRFSLVNVSNINQVLSANYYDLTLWTCLNASGLNSKNLIYEAMANGLCISAFAATSFCPIMG
jgi:hypothetical protein